jgi:hypothetical protein
MQIRCSLLNERIPPPLALTHARRVRDLSAWELAARGLPGCLLWDRLTCDIRTLQAIGLLCSPLIVVLSEAPAHATLSSECAAAEVAGPGLRILTS